MIDRVLAVGRALVVSCALALAGCALLPPAEAPAPLLDAGERAVTFDVVWEAVRDRYYDPDLHGVDWLAARERYRERARSAADDDAFWHTLQRLTAELHDAHTRVHDPRQALDRRREESVTVGLGFAFVGDAVAVASVEPDSEAQRRDVRPGDVVVAIDRVPAPDSWQRWRAEMGDSSTERSSRWRWLRGVVSGRPGTTLALSLERDGRRRTVALPRRVVSTALKVQATRLPSGVGHVAFNRFRPPLAAELKSALAELGTLRGLVLDLRGNGGGSIAEVRATLEVFVPARTRFAQSYTRLSGPEAAGRAADWTRPRDDAPAWSGPLAVLTDERTASGSELLASALRDVLGARVVGSLTCGCVLGIRRFEPLPGGAELAVSEIGFLSAGGRRLEGAGIVPDVTVAPTLAELRAGADPVLAAAERLLVGPPGPSQIAAPARTLPDTAPTMETAP